jgi:glycerol-3-phosphate acyltransferase PlsX
MAPQDKIAMSPDAGSARVVISVDAMGGDNGPAAVVAGLVISARALPDVDFIVHGDQAQLGPILAKSPELAPRVTLRHAPRAVTMADKPAAIMRSGHDTSMWGAVSSVRDGEAAVAVSCGNTGALMAVSMLRLRKLSGVNRPAIACFWPSRNASGFNIMLDVGADIKADAQDLRQFAAMGAAYAAVGLGLALPRVGLLNVGTEEHKGRAELHEAHDLLAQDAAGQFDFVGFVEGSDIPSNRVDVIVTDGFTGNIALKTGEGTAKLIGDFMRESFTRNLASKLAALLSMGVLRHLRRRIDPRRANGGVFLGLNGTVVKSHGGSDAVAFASAIALAHRLSRGDFLARLASRVRAGQTELASGGEAGASV